MPDLSTQTVHAFWHEYDATTLYKIICSIEQAENWIQPSEELEQIICDLGDILDTVVDIPPLKEETFVRLLTSIPFSQALRIMQFLETKKPGFVSHLLVWSDQLRNNNQATPEISLFLRRNVIFERLQLLSRIFSTERFNLIQKAKDSAHD